MANFPRLDELTVTANSVGLFNGMLVYYDQENRKDLDFANGLHNLWVALLDLTNERLLFITELEGLCPSVMTYKTMKFLNEVQNHDVIRLLELRKMIVGTVLRKIALNEAIRFSMDINLPCRDALLERFKPRAGRFAVAAYAEGVSQSSKGTILSTFSYGYPLSQVPGGWAAQKIGGRRVLLHSFILWSLTCALVPLDPNRVITLVIARLLGGVAQGLIFPSIHTVLAQWIPPHERSRSVSLTTSAEPALGGLWPLLWFKFASDPPRSQNPKAAASGFVMGVSNTAGTLAGIIEVGLTGQLLEAAKAIDFDLSSPDSWQCFIFRGCFVY
nr:probable anion transporter 5 [Tanacetum cinerariifolium]